MRQKVSGNPAPLDPEEEALRHATKKYVDQSYEIAQIEGTRAADAAIAAYTAGVSPTVRHPPVLSLEDERPFTLPGESVASRQIATGTRGAFSVQILNWGPRQINCESFTEYTAVRTLLAMRPDVVAVEEQLPPVVYTDNSGRQFKHFLDFRITLADGRRIGVAVKSEARARRSNFRQTLRCIARAMPKSVADELILVTDAMIPAEVRSFVSAVESARADLAHRPAIAAGDDAATAKVIATMAGGWTIGHLLRAIALPDGRGFRAVVRAIADGHLSVPDGFRLDEAEFVRCRPEVAACALPSPSTVRNA